MKKLKKKDNVVVAKDPVDENGKKIISEEEFLLRQDFMEGLYEEFIKTINVFTNKNKEFKGKDLSWEYFVASITVAAQMAAQQEMPRAQFMELAQSFCDIQEGFWKEKKNSLEPKKKNVDKKSSKKNKELN